MHPWVSKTNKPRREAPRRKDMESKHTEAAPDRRAEANMGEGFYERHKVFKLHHDNIFFQRVNLGNIFPVNSPSKILGTPDFSKFSKKFCLGNSPLKKKVTWYLSLVKTFWITTRYKSKSWSKSHTFVQNLWCKNMCQFETRTNFLTYWFIILAKNLLIMERASIIFIIENHKIFAVSNFWTDDCRLFDRLTNLSDCTCANQWIFHVS